MWIQQASTQKAPPIHFFHDSKYCETTRLAFFLALIQMITVAFGKCIFPSNAHSCIFQQCLILFLLFNWHLKWNSKSIVPYTKKKQFVCPWAFEKGQLKEYKFCFCSWDIEENDCDWGRKLDADRLFFPNKFAPIYVQVCPFQVVLSVYLTTGFVTLVPFHKNFQLKINTDLETELMFTIIKYMSNILLFNKF